jgi:hypothetical protein
MKVENNQNPFILLLPTGTYHKNLVIWILISLKSGEFRPSFSQEKFFVEVEIIFFRSKFGRISPQRKNTGPYCRQYKSAACFFFVVSALSPIRLFCQKRWMMPRHILIAWYAHFGPLIGTSCPLQSQNVHNRTQSVLGQHQNVFGHHQTHFGWANGQSRKKAGRMTIKTQC